MCAKTPTRSTHRAARRAVFGDISLVVRKSMGARNTHRLRTKGVLGAWGINVASEAVCAGAIREVDFMLKGLIQCFQRPPNSSGALRYSIRRHG